MASGALQPTNKRTEAKQFCGAGRRSIALIPCADNALTNIDINLIGFVQGEDFSIRRRYELNCYRAQGGGIEHIGAPWVDDAEYGKSALDIVLTLGDDRVTIESEIAVDSVLYVIWLEYAVETPVLYTAARASITRGELDLYDYRGFWRTLPTFYGQVFDTHENTTTTNVWTEVLRVTLAAEEGHMFVANYEVIGGYQSSSASGGQWWLRGLYKISGGMLVSVGGVATIVSQQAPGQLDTRLIISGLDLIAEVLGRNESIDWNGRLAVEDTSLWGDLPQAA